MDTGELRDAADRGIANKFIRDATKGLQDLSIARRGVTKGIPLQMQKAPDIKMPLGQRKAAYQTSLLRLLAVRDSVRETEREMAEKHARKVKPTVTRDELLRIQGDNIAEVVLADKRISRERKGVVALNRGYGRLSGERETLDEERRRRVRPNRKPLPVKDSLGVRVLRQQREARERGGK